MSHLSNGSSSSSQSVIGYDVNIEQWYLTLLDIGTWLGIFDHFLFYRLVALATPKEMFNYKITVTNTNTWCLLIIVTFGVLLRPVPLFPIPAAKVTGPLKALGEFWGGQIGWILAFLCAANFLSAAMNCFCVLAVFLLEPKGIIGSLTRRQGVIMGICSHLITTTIVTIFLTCVYSPISNLKTKLMAAYPELNTVLSADDTVVFGYDPTHSPAFMAPLVLLMFFSQGNIVSMLYVMLVRRVWRQISKGSTEETARSRRNVVLMLTARMSFPTLFGFFPLMLICGCLWAGVGQSFAFYCALTAIVITHGFQNVIGTIIAYRPYRRGAIQLFVAFLHIFGVNGEKLLSGGECSRSVSLRMVGGGITKNSASSTAVVKPANHPAK